MKTSARVRARPSNTHDGVVHLQLEQFDVETGDTLEQRSVGSIRRRSLNNYELSLSFNPNYPSLRVSMHKDMREAEGHFLKEMESLREVMNVLPHGAYVIGMKS